MTQPTLDDLPEELLNYIALELRPEYEETDFQHPRDLLDLCLVSKRWCRIAQPHVFQVFTTDDGMDGSEDDRKLPPFTSGIFQAASGAVIDFGVECEESKEVQKSIYDTSTRFLSRVEMIGTSATDLGNAEERYSMTKLRPVVLLPSLKSLSIVNCMLDQVLQWPGQSCNVDDLELDGATFRTQAFASFLRIFKRLKILDLEVQSDADLNSGSDFPIFRCYDFQSIISPQMNNLEKLSIRGDVFNSTARDSEEVLSAMNGSVPFEPPMWLASMENLRELWLPEVLLLGCSSLRHPQTSHAHSPQPRPSFAQRLSQMLPATLCSFRISRPPKVIWRYLQDLAREISADNEDNLYPGLLEVYVMEEGEPPHGMLQDYPEAPGDLAGDISTTKQPLGVNCTELFVNKRWQSP